MYRSLITLVGIKGNPDTNRMLQTCLITNKKDLMTKEYTRLNINKLNDEEIKDKME
jgi:hypothetical protein